MIHLQLQDPISTSRMIGFRAPFPTAPYPNNLATWHSIHSTNLPPHTLSMCLYKEAFSLSSPSFSMPQGCPHVASPCRPISAPLSLSWPNQMMEFLGASKPWKWWRWWRLLAAPWSKGSLLHSASIEGLQATRKESPLQARGRVLSWCFGGYTMASWMKGRRAPCMASWRKKMKYSWHPLGEEEMRSS